MKFQKKYLSYMLWGVSILIFSFGSYFVYKHISLRDEIENKIKEKIENKVNEELEKVNEELESIKNIAVSISEILNKKELSEDQIRILLQNTLTKKKDLVGIGIAFEHFAFNKDVKLFAPYYQKKDDEIISTPIDYDYTTMSKGKLKPKINWYTTPLSKGEAWSDPYYNSKKQIVVGEYAKAFYKKDEEAKDKPLGVIFVEFNLDAIKNILSYLSLGKTGYGFLLSSNGTFISHYIENYVKSEKSIFDLERENKKESLVGLGKKMLNDKTGIVNYTDSISEDIQKESWAFLHKIKPSGWHFAAIYFKDEVFGRYISIFKKNKILITVFMLFFLLFLLSGFIFIKPFRNETSWVIYSILISLLLVAGIGVIWNLSFDESLKAEENKVVITSRSDSLNYFNSKEGQISIENPVYIPTGIIVNHLEFLDVNTVHVSGYLWQKFPEDVKNENLPKILFEKAVNSNIEIKKIYLQDGEKIVEMDFKCELPVITQYHKYPFDHQMISINMILTDRISDRILIPDFQAYPVITPSSLPGVSKTISLKGWNFKKSFFAYSSQLENVTYGLKDEIKKSKPLLSFNIIIKRHILQPFLSIILPLIIILFLMFMLLLSVDKLNILTLFSVTSALMLSIIFSHVALRDKFPISGFFYLEYFFLVSYFLIVLIALDVFFFFKAKREFKFLKYKDNLISKLIYWPLTLFIIFTLTVFVFYN